MTGDASIGAWKRPRITVAALVCVTLAAWGVIFWTGTWYRIPETDHPIWFARAQRLPWNVRGAADYHDATDLPALNRWLYAAAVRITGAVDLPCPPPYLKRLDETSGRDAWMWKIPRRAELSLRAADSLFFALFITLMLVAARQALGYWALAPLALLPFLTSKSLFIAQHKVGPDAALFFGLALVLVVWQRYHNRGEGVSWRAVVWVGAAAGVATSAKYNGAIALVAYAAYAAVHARGMARLAKPAAACAVALAVFCIINPVMFASGRAPWQVVETIVARRIEVINGINDTFGRQPLLYTWEKAVPAWMLLPFLIAAQAVAVRRFRAVEPAVWWGAFLVVVTTLTINYPMHWYVAPAHVGLYFPSAVAVIALAHRYIADNLVMPGWWGKRKDG